MTTRWRRRSAGSSVASGAGPGVGAGAGGGSRVEVSVMGRRAAASGGLVHDDVRRVGIGLRGPRDSGRSGYARALDLGPRRQGGEFGRSRGLGRLAGADRDPWTSMGWVGGRGGRPGRRSRGGGGGAGVTRDHGAGGPERDEPIAIDDVE